MKEQVEVDIYTFKKGDEITRLKPMVDEMGEKDYTFIGSRVKFMGIANASIYLSRDLDVLTMLFSGGRTSQVIKVPLELWEKGWAYYVEPDFLDEDEMGFEVDEEAVIQDQIDQAVIEDNFEKAEVLRKRLEELKKQKKDGKTGTSKE